MPVMTMSNFPLWSLRDKVKEMSKGELTLEILGGPEVVPALDQATATKKGVVDMANVFSAAYTGLVPVSNVLGLSTLSGVEERQVGFYDFLAEQHAKAGLFYLGRSAQSTSGIFSILIKKNISRPQELAGMKIAVGSLQSNAFLKEMGAIPVYLTTAETYIAVDTGVVSGYLTTTNVFTSIKMQELPLYLIDHRYYGGNITFIMNPATWSKLSPQHKDLLTKAVLEVEKETPTRFTEELDKSKQALLSGKVKLITFSTQDIKWYVDTAIRAGWDEQIKINPVLASRAKELIEKKL